MTKKRLAIRGWQTMFLLLASAAVSLWVWWSDDEPVAAGEVATQRVAPASAVEAAAPSFPEDAASPAVEAPLPDAGKSSDAGSAPVERLTENQRIEETMRRWRQALAPLFRPNARNPKPPPAAIAVSGEPPPEPEGKRTCEAGVRRLPLGEVGSIDIVIAIDTSGSMIGEMNEVIRWLSELELALRNKGSEFQMLVVADHVQLRRMTSAFMRRAARDGGDIQARIGSTDAFETLISAARHGLEPRWTQLLKPRSTKHVIIVTDDEANDPDGVGYLAPLMHAANGRLGPADAPAFSLHLLGGLDPIAQAEVMLSKEPLATQQCPLSVAAGLAYQRLAQLTGGLRASLCYRASIQAFTRALVEWPVVSGVSRCMWLLQGESKVVDARALGGVTPMWLGNANDANSCHNRRDAYLSSGPVFALCGSTCAFLFDAGYNAIDVSTQCER